jgi:hypothetical protein
MNQGLQNPIDAGLGDLCLLKNFFEGDRRMILLQQFEHVERLGEDGDQVQPLDFCLGQPFASSLQPLNDEHQ